MEIKTKLVLKNLSSLFQISKQDIYTFCAIFFLFVCSVYCLRFKRPILFILQLDMPVLVPSHWFVPAFFAIFGK